MFSRILPLMALSLFVNLTCSAEIDGKKFDPTYFGMHVHRSVPNTIWKKANIGSIRLHDANVTWLDLEQSPGVWNWEKLDRIVFNALSAKVDILLPLQGTPTWAASDSTSKGAYGMGANTMPKNIEYWNAYVSKVATQYKGKIAAYEIWNEPNLKQFFNGTPEELAILVKSASKIIHAIDPNAKVVCSGITSDYGIDWLKRFFATGVGKSCDVISYHFYTHHEPPETMVSTIKAVKSAMSEYGLSHLPLWNTETGWLIGNKIEIDHEAAGFKSDAKVIDQIEAASFVTRSLILAKYFGVERFYWYSWDHKSMGLTGDMGRVITTSSNAYKTVSGLLIDSRLEICTVENKYWKCDFNSKNYNSFSILWATEGKTTYAKKEKRHAYKLSGVGDFDEIEYSDQVTLNANSIVLLKE